MINTHERLVQRPLGEVFQDLVALGTPADRIWPSSKMTFRRTAGPLQAGITEEQHGAIHAVLEAYEPNRRIVWRANQSFLKGTHSFEVAAAEGGQTLVRHQIDAKLAWWFAPIWYLLIGRMHDQILEKLLDRVAQPPVQAKLSV